MFSKKTPEPTTRLRELSGSDFTMAKGESDIRGWDVRDANSRKFGTVQDLIFDIRTGKVRYLVLQVLDTRELELEKRQVLVPIGLAELDPNDNDVLLPSVNPFQLRALPRYDRAHLGAKIEKDISIVFGQQAFSDQHAATSETDDQYYNHDHFNQDNLYRRRRLQQQQPGQQMDEHPDRNYMPPNAGTLNNDSMPANASRYGAQDQPFSSDHESDEAYYRRTGQRRKDY